MITNELLETIDNYLKGNLSEADHLSFEKQIESNKELEEIVEIQKQLFAIHGFETSATKPHKNIQKDLRYYKDQLRTPENQDLSAKIRQIGQNYVHANSTTKKNYFKYYIVASIAILFGTFLLLNSNSSLENYYKDNVNWEELPSFIDKGQAENDFTKGEISFKNKEYKKAIASFSNITSENELFPYSLMYIGASYELLNENDKALAIFDELSTINNFDERSKVYWFKLLIYTKVNNKEKAKEMQNIIVKDSDNYNYDKAIKLKL